MSGKTRYHCSVCSTSKVVPERPSSAPATIRTGCAECGTLRTHKRAGAWFP